MVVPLTVNTIRQTRVRLDVTVRELAVASGIHSDTIHRLESYKHTPTAPTLARLAAGLADLTGNAVTFDPTGLAPALSGSSESTRSRRADPHRAARIRRARQATLRQAG